MTYKEKTKYKYFFFNFSRLIHFKQNKNIIVLVNFQRRVLYKFVHRCGFEKAYQLSHSFVVDVIGNEKKIQSKKNEVIFSLYLCPMGVTCAFKSGAITTTTITTTIFSISFTTNTKRPSPPASILRVCSMLLSRWANGRTASRRFVFHFGLIYCTQATLALFSTPRHSATPHPTNVPHKTWYQRSSNGDLQSLQALPVTINSLG